MNTFTHVKEGDTVRRMLAGVIPMDLPVTEITDTLIICGGGYEFYRDTGIEHDDFIPIQVSHLVEIDNV
jgi:hypothetical protein